jgi:proteasome lid subunit RPN8/RPN11
MHATAPHDRIEVGDGPSLRIPSAVWHELVLHAREAFPEEECCGLVTGDGSERYREVHRCRNVQGRLNASDPARHPRTAREAFSIDAQEYLRIVDQAEAHGHALTAVYHSHVGFGLYFSELDQEYAAGHPDADHIVISIADDSIEIGIFRRVGARFVGWRAEADAP